MDYRQVASELVTVLRGRRSQNQLSQKLGFAYNQVSRWESGTRAIRWLEFVDLCRVVRAPLAQSANMALGGGVNLACPADVFRRILGLHTAASAAAELQISVKTVRRWLQEGANPTLWEALLAIELLQRNLHPFLGGLVPEPLRLPTLHSELHRQAQTAELYGRFPELGCVELCLDLADYHALPAHQPGFIARRIGLTLDQETLFLAMLTDLGLATFAAGKYRVTRTGFMEITASWEHTKALAMHWRERALARLRTLNEFPRQDRFRYLLASAHEDTVRRLEEETRIYLKRVTDLINREQDSKRNDRLVVVLSDIFALNGDL